MKKVALSLLFLIVASHYALSQEFYAFFPKDALQEYYAGWLLPLTAEVHIDSYDETQADKAQKENNKKGGIENGAVFAVTSFGADEVKTPNSISSAQVRFTDNAGTERFDVKGVTFHLVYKVDGKILENPDLIRIVPKSAIDQGDKRGELINAYTLNRDYLKSSQEIPGKYVFVYDSKKTYPLPLSNRIHLAKNDKKDNVSAIEFALSDEKNGTFVPNFTIPVSDFKTDKKGCWVLIVDAILALLAASSFFFCRKKKEEEKNEVVEQTEPVGDVSQLLNIKADELKNAIEGISFEPVQTKLSAIEKNLSEVKSLVSNTDDKKRITDLTGKLTQKETENADLSRKINKTQSDLSSQAAIITALKTEVEDLKQQLIIKGTETISGAEQFTSFAQHLLDIADRAEAKVIEDWQSIPQIGIIERAGYLITAELSGRPTKEINRWRGILTTLQLKSVISDEELIKYVKTVPETERVDYLTKQFVDTVVRPYVSNVLVLLEQFRTGAEWGYSSDADSYATIINDILTVCKGADISVDYRKLYEKLNNFDTVEIDDVVPEPISGWIDSSRKDIVLYVKNYAISSKLSNDTVKTSCVVRF